MVAGKGMAQHGRHLQCEARGPSLRELSEASKEAVFRLLRAFQGAKVVFLHVFQVCRLELVAVQVRRRHGTPAVPPQDPERARRPIGQAFRCFKSRDERLNMKNTCFEFIGL